MKKIARIALLGLTTVLLASCKSGGQLSYDEMKAVANKCEASSLVGKKVSSKQTIKVTDYDEANKDKINAFLLDLGYADPVFDVPYILSTESEPIVYEFPESYLTALNAEDYILDVDTVEMFHELGKENDVEEIYTESGVDYQLSIVYLAENQKTNLELYEYDLAEEYTFVYDKEGRFLKAEVVSAYTVCTTKDEKEVVDYSFVIDMNFNVNWAK